ncbi:winged helix DNA-binding domain-containing protein [Rhodococcus gannanensis]|uniref:Winged helix DNA-binding domain-containing protein n=1 Tax=Rhodococcus gannanensis TaxID=1960308 RepID=A0ABW4P0E8_9NOCA
MRDTLDVRELGRATLARQYLLERTALSAVDATRHLYGLQAQSPTAPYFALWTRLTGFGADQLSQLIEDGAVVRIVTMRGTVHAVTAEDARELRPWTQPIMDRDLRTNAQHAKALAGFDRDALESWSREHLEAAPSTLAALRPLLAERWPDRDPAALAHAVRDVLPLVQVPPRGLWGRSGQPVCTTLEHWTGSPLTEPDPERIVVRYLAAYGPATVADAQAWSGLTRLGEVFDRLRDRLRVFGGPDGVELFDLPDAPRPGGDAPAPVRILAPFDSVLLAHANRSRVLDDAHRRVLFTVNGIVKPALLLDGEVAGHVTMTSGRDGAVAEVTGFRPLSKRVMSEVATEVRDLLEFAHPGLEHDVRIAWN